MPIIGDRLPVQSAKVLLNRGWLSTQPDEFKQLILEKSELIVLKSHQLAHTFEDEPAGIYGVLNGGILTFVPRLDGTVLLATILRAGDWFGHGPFLTERPRTLSFAAREESRLLYVPLASLREMTAMDHQTMRRVSALSEFGVDISVRVVGDLLIRRSDKRIAATLLRIAGVVEPASRPDVATLHVSQSELAEMANCSRDLINRTLSKMEKAGWLTTHYNQITLSNIASIWVFAYEDG